MPSRTHLATIPREEGGSECPSWAVRVLPAFANPQVNLYAAELPEALRFYRDVLGFTESFRFPREGAPEHVELGLGSFKLGIATYEALKRHPGLSTDRGPIRFELGLGTDDVDGAHGWATSHGAPSVHTPYDFLGYVHAATVTDPEGNPVVFHSRLPVRTKSDPTSRPTFKSHLYNLYTRDLEKSLRFYRDLLGFTETFRVPKEGSPDHVEMELGPLELAVSTLEALKRDHGLTGGGGPPRGEVVFSVPDVDAAFAWICGRGATALSPPHDFATVLRGAWVGDPDGNPVQLFARRTGR